MAVYRDVKVKGLGVRVLPSGTSSTAWITRRRVAGAFIPSAKLLTGNCPPCANMPRHSSTASATKASIRAGELKADREAPTVADLCERFTKEHMLRKLRASTRVDYTRMIAKEVLPEFGNRKVSSIQFEDIDRLHRKITDRAHALLLTSAVPYAASFSVWHVSGAGLTTIRLKACPGTAPSRATDI